MPSHHANRGLAAEAEIILANQYYRREGIAVVEKVPTEFIPLRGPDGRIVRVKVTRPSTCDMLGCWQGKPIAFEVKSSSKTRWSLKEVKPHQLEFLRDWQKCGGISFILLCHSIAHWRLITLDRYQRWLYIGTKSLDLNDMQCLPICVDIDGCAVDYLETLRLVTRR